VIWHSYEWPHTKNIIVKRLLFGIIQYSVGEKKRISTYCLHKSCSYSELSLYGQDSKKLNPENLRIWEFDSQILSPSPLSTADPESPKWKKEPYVLSKVPYLRSKKPCVLSKEPHLHPTQKAHIFCPLQAQRIKKVLKTIETKQIVYLLPTADSEFPRRPEKHNFCRNKFIANKTSLVNNFVSVMWPQKTQAPCQWCDFFLVFHCQMSCPSLSTSGAWCLRDSCVAWWEAKCTVGSKLSGATCCVHRCSQTWHAAQRHIGRRVCQNSRGWRPNHRVPYLRRLLSAKEPYV